MADLKTNYLGTELKNPIVAGASNLVNDLDNVRKLEDAGVGAIVYKSLFEEQIMLETYEFEREMEEYNERHAEMQSLFPTLKHAGPKEHILNLEKAKKAVDIPVFASLNCIENETWSAYAEELYNIGIDGLELNFYSVPKDFNVDDATVVNNQIQTLEEVLSKIEIPVAIKLSPFYSNPLHVISEMDSAGGAGFVLFNRLFQPDIDIEKEESFYPYHVSNPDDNRLALRFAGLLYGNIAGNIITSGGVFDGFDVIKMILAGATASQVVSTIYKNGIGHISTMLKQMEQWMDEKEYNSLDDFRGKLSKKNSKDPFAYKRAQYVDILLNSDKIFKNYSLK